MSLLDRFVLKFHPSSNVKSNNKEDGKGLINGEMRSQYEEIVRSSVPCPSCKGSGKIPREQEAKLIALIPYTDDRLKPRRTLLYVSLSVFVCLILSSVCIFFLIPRSASLSSITRLITTNVTINKTESTVFVSAKNSYEVKNTNYLPISVKKISMVAIFDSKRMESTSQNMSILVAPRSHRYIHVPINLTFTGHQGELIAIFCTFEQSWSHSLLFEFQATLDFTYLGHDAQTSITEMQYVDCGKMSKQL